MRILFDLKHPAQVRFFVHAVAALRRGGDDVLVTSRHKDETVALLDRIGMPHICLSRMGSGLLGMGAELAGRTCRMLKLARRFRPDVLVARTGITIGLVGKALGIPRVVFDDTEFAWLQRSLSVPLATVVCTGMGYHRRFPGKQREFAAPPQLLYTHPARFAPDPDILRKHGIEPEEPYVVVRVKAWRALHDMGVQQPADDRLSALVRQLRRFGRPVITSERPLPEPLCRFRSPLPVEHALDLLAFARLYVGEGSCMAAEAACLGTPAVFISPVSRRGYLDALEERYGLVKTVTDHDAAARVAGEWLADPDQPRRFRDVREEMVRECDDPLDFMLNIIRDIGNGARS